MKKPKKKPAANRCVVTCMKCGHRGERKTIRSRCPMCGVKSSYSNTV